MSVGKFYLKTLAVLVVLAVVLTSILSIVLNRIYARTAVSEVERISQTMVAKSSYYAEFVHRQVMALGAAALTGQAGNDAIHEYLLLDDRSALVQYYAQRQLAERVDILGFVRSIGLFNSRSGDYISTEGVGRDREKGIVESIVRGVGRDYHVFPDLVEGEHVLRYIIYDSSFRKGSMRNAVVIDISDSTLGEHARTSQFLAGSVLILDRSGNLLHRDGEAGLVSHGVESDYADDILGSGEDNGTLLRSIGSRSYLITYQKNETTGWTIVFEVPYESITATADAVQRKTLAAAALVLITSLALVGALSRYLYSPIRALVDRVGSGAGKTAAVFSEMEMVDNAYRAVQARADELYRKREVDKRELAHRFLARAMATELSPVELREGLEKYEVSLPPNAYRLVVFDYDGPQGARLDRSVLVFVGDQLPALSAHPTVRVATTRWAVLYPATADSSVSELKAACSDTRERIASATGLSVSAGISGIKSSIVYLRSAYTECTNVLKHRLIHGPALVFAVDDELGTADPVYPDRLEKRMIEGIRLVDRHRYGSAIDELLTTSQRWSGPSFEYVIVQLSFEARKHMRRVLAGRGFSASASILYPNDTLLTAYGPQAVKQWFESLFEYYEEMSQQRTRMGVGQEAKIQDVMAYIDHHYDDPLLSLDRVAAEMKLSRGHLSRLFKKANNTTFSAHVARLRLNRAQHLLVESDKAIEEVSAESGFNSIHYFYHFFKRQTGVTPVQYRHAHAADVGSV